MTTKIITNNTAGGDYSGTVDTNLNSFSPTSPNSSDIGIEMDNMGSAYPGVGLLKFTGLSNITGPVTVSAVTLSLYLYQENPSLWNCTLNLRRMLRNWTNSATWNTYDGTNNWTTAGAQSDGNDRATPASGSFPNWSPSSNGVYYDLTGSAGMIADVQGWINGTLNNYGWLMECTDGTNAQDYKRPQSADGTNGNRPKLSVTYSSGGGFFRTVFGGALSGLGVGGKFFQNPLQRTAWKRLRGIIVPSNYGEVAP